MGSLADLLAWVDSRKRVAKRNLRDLISDTGNALEKTGQPTGLQPWKPGEYKLRDLLSPN